VSIRTDLDKVLNYCKFQGIKVHFRISTRTTEDAAEIDFITKTITIWHKRSDSLKSIVASLLHELSHIISYSTNKHLFIEYFRVSSLDNPSKEDRYQIYQRELEDIAKMPALAELMALGIAKEYLGLWVLYDTWQYRYYWLNGVYPPKPLKKIKRNKIGLKS